MQFCYMYACSLCFIYLYSGKERVWQWFLGWLSCLQDLCIWTHSSLFQLRKCVSVHAYEISICHQLPNCWGGYGPWCGSRYLPWDGKYLGPKVSINILYTELWFCHWELRCILSFCCVHYLWVSYSHNKAISGSAGCLYHKFVNIVDLLFFLIRNMSLHNYYCFFCSIPNILFKSTLLRNQILPYTVHGFPTAIPESIWTTGRTYNRFIAPMYITVELFR